MSIVRTLTYPFLALAIIGFFISIASHVAAVLGRNGPLGDFSWLLHVGIFVVWIPAVFAARRLAEGANQHDFWKAVLRGAPPWMRYVFYGVCVYAAANFLWFFVTSVNANEQPAEGIMPPSVVRGFSGHWLIFYGGAFLVLYSSMKVTEPNPICPSGHSVSPFAQFCEQCGAQVGSRTAV